MFDMFHKAFAPPQATVLISEPGPMLLLAKIIGAIAGSLISIAYILPKGRREAALRFAVGLVVGIVFGGTAGLKVADMLGLLGKVSAFETTLMGASLASLCAWWALGVLRRLAERWSPTGPFAPPSRQQKD